MSAESQRFYDDNNDRIQAVACEGELMMEEGEYGTLVAIFALADVIKRPIYSIYLNVTYTLRDLFHRLIVPAEKTVDEPIYLLWTRSKTLDAPGKFQPNHFVPVVRV